MKGVSCNYVAREEGWACDAGVHGEYTQKPKGVGGVHILPSGPKPRCASHFEWANYAIGVINSCVSGYEFAVACVGGALLESMCDVVQG